MPTDHRDELKKIRTFPSLVRYLRDEMGWPIQQESFEDVDDLFYDFTPEELGLDAGTAAKIESIRRLRPLSTGQPWGIYFVKFEPKRLPVVALRRILSRVALKKRASANRSDMPSWQANDLLFVSNYGDQEQRCITFAHFTQHDEKDDLPTLKVLGWDSSDTPLHLDDVADKLRSKLRWPDDPENLTMWRDSWRSAFTLEHREVITTSKALAVRLAELARAIRDRIRTVLAIEAENGPVTKLMRAFQEALVHDLDGGGFADMYAQTIAYGLLSARITNPKANTADGFAAQLPVTNPFLKELMETFLHVGGRKGKVGRGAGIDFDELGVSEVVELLDDANMEAVVRDFGDKNPQEDPVIHFYELFLKEYDKKQKVSRGVFYTPRPVVSYIVRSVDELLRTEFGLEDGLADTATWGEMAKRHKDLKIPEGISPDHAFVQILDPATGTGTFLVEVIDLIHKTLVAKWKAQGHGEKKIEALWNEYVPKHLLTRLHGYELLMAPYAIAHLKIGLKLHETGYRFGSDERARIYLTNALEPVRDFSGHFEFAIPALAHEAQAVNEIKRQQRFTVIVGNPPYSGVSSNRGDWIERLIDDYRTVDGKPLGEKKVWLRDDYVKFVRLASWLIYATGAGIAGLITNNSFFDGLTFRGMRAHLMETFANAVLLNLHGNGNLKETAPDGSADENVFDILQGVGISLLTRKVDSQPRGAVRAADLFGTRQAKYSALLAWHPAGVSFAVIQAVPPNYFFVQRDARGFTEYEDFVSVSSLFEVGGLGFQSHRDALVVAFSKEELIARLTEFFDLSLSDKEVKSRFGIDDYERFVVANYRRTNRLDPKCICKVQYRPFDYRYVYYADLIIQRWLIRVHGHMLKTNRGLNIMRQTKAHEWRHVMVSATPTPAVFVEIKDGSCQYPLYRYAEYSESLFAERSRESNFHPGTNRDWTERLGASPAEPAGEPKTVHLVSHESIFGYIYAVLHSPSYRHRYAEFLKIDFPRVPLTGNASLFYSLSRLGGELVDLHLMESPKLDHFITTYNGPRNPEVGRVGWSKDTVWLDAAATKKGQPATCGTVGFRGVPEAVWDFHIGGYQVCEKWLKDRKGRALSADDIAHYQKIVVALSETIRLMREIDEVIDGHGGWPGAFAGGSTAERETDRLPKVAEPQAEYNASKDKRKQ